jgi:sugar lactone lactonase YvrE
MAITVKHTKVSTIPDGDDSSLIRPSDWNDDHTLTGTIPVANGGTGAATLTGYVKGNGTADMTASTTIPNTDVTGLGTMSTQNANNVAITGGTMSGVTVSGYIPTTEKAQPLGVATLDAGGKVPTSQIPMQGDLNYQGTWNASTNTPTLVSSTGTKGYYYVVDVAGTTNLDGITDWQIGDWAIYNGTVWQKVDNTDQVTSVNGQTGAVVLTTTNVAEGTNQYFTQARARSSVSGGTGISYDSSTGVITNSSPSLGGDVVGPSSATDNAVARFDTTTGKLLQNSVVLVGDTGVVTGVTELTASTKVVSPHFDAQNSAGGQLRNASGTPQLQWGGGGGNNITFDVAANLNPANAQVDISPTGTGTVRINPATASSMNNVVIGATTPLAGSFTNLSVTGTTSFDGSQGTSGQVLTSAGTGNTPTWTTPTTGTVTSVDATGGTGISVSGGPITSNGTLTITNTAPDQTVVLTAGTGITTSGTYPSFTVTNSDRGSSQNIFKNIAVLGQSTVVADNNNDTVILANGTGVSITTNATTDTVTFTNTAPDQTVVLTAGTGISTSGTYPNFTITNTSPNTYNPSSVAITGGSINGTTIGATTASTGRFSEISITTLGGDADIVANNEVSSWIYANLTKSVAADETAPNGVFFKPDGTRMYIAGDTGNDITQYTLSTAWNVSTASTPVTFSISAQEGTIQDLFFKDDGTTMYIIGSSNDAIYQYTLGTAWDISTASYASKSFSVASQETGPAGLWFKSDGTSMYVVGATADTVFQYTLSTAWDVSTASYASISFVVAAQDTTPTSLAFSPDGSIMYMLGSTNDRISQYTLGTPWNVSTATYVDAFYVGNEEQTPTGLFVSTANEVAYVCGSSSDAVFQYDTNVNSIQFDSLNTVFPNRVTVENDLYVQDRLAVGGAFQVYGSASLSTTNIAGSLTASGNISATSTTGTINLGTSQTTGLFSIGGTAQTGAIVVGQSTGVQTLSIANGATASGSTKTVNIGANGVSGSTTNINIGSAVSGATTNTNAYGSWTFNTPLGNSNLANSSITINGTAVSLGGSYSIPTATSTTLGLIELGSDTVQTVAPNAVSATASRSYALQLNSAGQAVVNVPWTDTNSGGTVTSVSGTGTVNGLTLTGTVTNSGNLTLGGTLDLSSPPAIGGTAPNTVNGTVLNATNGIVVNSNTVSASYTIPAGSSGMSAGPMTVASGQTVTVSSGSRWVIL